MQDNKFRFNKKSTSEMGCFSFSDIRHEALKHIQKSLLLRR